MAQISKEVRVQTGVGPDGKKEWLHVGYVTEQNFGKGNVQRRVWLHLSALNPVLFAQVRQYVGKSSYVCLDPVELARRKPGPDMPEAEPEAAEEGLATDPDTYADEGQFMTGSAAAGNAGGDQ